MPAPRYDPTAIRPSWKQGFARSASEALPEYRHVWNGLVGMWVPSLGATGNLLRDISGRKNHGTLNNFTLSSAWPVGQHGTVLDHDGTNDYVAIPHSSALTPLNAGSVSFWAKADVTNVEQYVIDKSINTNGLFAFIIRNSAVMDFFVYAGGFAQINNIPVDTNWHHWVGTWSDPADTMELFKDGASAGTASLGGSSPSDVGKTIDIGRTQNGGPPAQQYNGQIDDIRMHNRVLSPWEVQQLYRHSFNSLIKDQFALAAAVAVAARRIFVVS